MTMHGCRDGVQTATSLAQAWARADLALRVHFSLTPLPLSCRQV